MNYFSRERVNLFFSFEQERKKKIQLYLLHLQL
jgi:hypothetical protein